MPIITSNFTVEDAARRIDGFLRRARDAWMASGAVTGSSISIILIQRSGNSIFRPEFSGTLEPMETGCELKGEFGFSRIAKKVAAFWFAFVGVWIVLSIVVVTSTAQPNAWVLPSSGGFLLVCGAALLTFARWYYRSDRKWILHALSQELHGTPVSDTPRGAQSAGGGVR